MSPLRSAISYVRHPRRVARLLAQHKRMQEVTAATPEPLPKCPNGQKPLIVSLTSYGTRLQTVHLAVKSMMMQTVKPNKVVLYLDEGSNGAALPAELTELQDLGLEIRGGYENLRCHLKYYPAMAEFPGADLVTVDDDAVYAPDVIGSLVRAKGESPDCVLARRVHRIVIRDELCAPYTEWDWEWREPTPIPRSSLLATGVGGVLYPAGILTPDALDVAGIKKTSLQADDLWLKAVEASKGVKVRWAPNACMHPYLIEGSQDAALYTSNVLDNQNDSIWSTLIDHFGLEPASFTDD